MKHIYEPNVEMTTRDGTKLMADVWHPAEGKAPALLLRTPYGKQMVAEGVNAGGLPPALLALINAGYAVMIQDTRGTGKSEGHFEPKLAEIPKYKGATRSHVYTRGDGGSFAFGESEATIGG